MLILIRIFKKLYVTNLSYVPEEVKRQKWYEEVDCSYALADIIYHMNTSCALKTKEEEKKGSIRKNYVKVFLCHNCIIKISKIH